jgi:hypothetical protein
MPEAHVRAVLCRTPQVFLSASFDDLKIRSTLRHSVITLPMVISVQNAQDFLFEYFGRDVAERTVGDYPPACER